MKLFESKDAIAKTLTKWNKMTFGEGYENMLHNATNEDEKVMQLMDKIIRTQGLTNKRMNGFASEHLKVAEFERMGVKYVDFFNHLEEGDKEWTPCDIIHDVCEYALSEKGQRVCKKQAKKLGYTEDQIACRMVGRAIRALPSYIREYQLNADLHNLFPQAIFDQSSDLDIKYHCDVKMELDGKPYYIWSFVSSKRSIYNFIDKFKNNRCGHVMDGTHVLCPFNMKDENMTFSSLGWSFYSNSYMKELYEAVTVKDHFSYADTPLTSNTFYSRPAVIDKADDT